MRLLRHFMFLALPLLLLQCAGQSKLISNGLSDSYMEQEYGYTSDMRLYFAAEYEMEKFIGDEEKQKSIGFAYEPKRYLLYTFRLNHTPKKMDRDLKFILADQKTNSLIERIEARYYTTSDLSGNWISYSLVSTWIIKLVKPFTIKDLEPGKYNLKIIFPNKEEIIYELNNAK